MKIIIIFFEVALLITLLSIFLYFPTGGFEYTPYNFLNHQLKVYSLRNPILVLFILLIVLYLIERNTKIKVKPFSRPINFLIIFILIYLGLVLPSLLDQYFNFQLALANETGVKLQISYGLFFGEPRTTIFEYVKNPIFNYFGDHFAPILIVLAPIFVLIPSPWFALIVQVLMAAGGGIVIFLLAKDVLEDEWLALFPAVLYLINPVNNRGFFYGLRFEYFSITFVFLSFYFILKRRYFWFMVFYLLASICKETVPITIAPLGVFLAIKEKEKKWKIFGVCLFICSILYTVLFTKIVMPAICGFKKIHSLASYPSWKEILETPSVVFREYVSSAKIWSVVLLLISLGFLPAFSRITLLGAIGLLGDLLVKGSGFISKHPWHAVGFYQFFIIGSIYGLKNLKKFLGHFNREIQRGVYISLFSLAFFYSMFTNFYEWVVYPFFSKELYEAKVPRIYKEIELIKDKIPPGSTVLTYRSVVSEFVDFYKPLLFKAGRGVDYERLARKVDYIVHPLLSSLLTKAEEQKFLRLISVGKYALVYWTDGVELYCREDEYREKVAYFFDFVRDRDNLEKEWEIQPMRVTYDIVKDEEYLGFKVLFDGDDKEDEYLRLSTKIDVNFEKFPLMEITSILPCWDIQVLEIIVGVDRNEDGIEDGEIKKWEFDYTKSVLRWNIYQDLLVRYPAFTCYNGVRLSLHLHKIWWRDCSGRKARSYDFYMKNLKILQYEFIPLESGKERLWEG